MLHNFKTWRNIMQLYVAADGLYVSVKNLVHFDIYFEPQDLR